MKFRHLKALGYTVKELPFWTYDVNLRDSSKQEIIRKLLRKNSAD
jgi:hypothetical protein